MAFDFLNLHHLLYFRAVAREGGVVRASQRLRVSPPTVSAQVKQLEEQLGAALFLRSQRRLVLTDLGRTVLHYADGIFDLSEELRGAVRSGHDALAGRLRVGVSMALPKLIAHRLLEPALALEPRVELVCIEDKPRGPPGRARDPRDRSRPDRRPSQRRGGRAGLRSQARGVRGDLLRHRSDRQEAPAGLPGEPRPCVDAVPDGPRRGAQRARALVPGSRDPAPRRRLLRRFRALEGLRLHRGRGCSRRHPPSRTRSRASTGFARSGGWTTSGNASTRCRSSVD